jgi:hypothetical protein
VPGCADYNLTKAAAFFLAAAVPKLPAAYTVEAFASCYDAPSSNGSRNATTTKLTIEVVMTKPAAASKALQRFIPENEQAASTAIASVTANTTVQRQVMFESLLAGGSFTDGFVSAIVASVPAGGSAIILPPNPVAPMAKVQTVRLPELWGEQREDSYAW